MIPNLFIDINFNIMFEIVGVLHLRLRASGESLGESLMWCSPKQGNQIYRYQQNY